MNERKLKRISAGLCAGWEKKPDKVLGAVLAAFSRRPAGRGLRFSDDGYIMSLAGDSGSLRFFAGLDCRLDLLRPAASRSLVRLRLNNFSALCRSLNRCPGFSLDADLASDLAERLLRDGRLPGWPFFGAKLKPDGGCVLTVYFSNTPWEEGLGWTNIGAILELAGLKPGGMEKLRLTGAFDCAGISLSSDGGRSLKIYTRFPFLAAGGGLAALRRLHGAVGAGFLKRCWKAAESRPVRHWTNAYGFEPGTGRPVSVKTEMHFREPVPAAEAMRLLDIAPGSREGAQWRLLLEHGCAVTTLAAQKGLRTLYFTA
ncbi:MAG: hypothetical protein M0011_06645 [Elusimicrobia bacterium]|nr:hypothetical protein [Elusimicrobiota bacterium]